MRIPLGAPTLRALLPAAGEGPTDGHLLGAFLASGDGTAFAALVRRHGPMVLGVCRRLLAHRQDAEDAFQATFLVLARRAAAVAAPDRLGNWLYGVARRTALEARRRRVRTQAHERQVGDMPHPHAAPAEPAGDLDRVLDTELARLPEWHRLPVLLCDLEGRPRRAVARQLGIPEGTLSNRLAAARRALAARLTRRGITLSVAGLTAALAEARAAAVVPAALAEAARQTARGVAPAAVQTLTNRVLTTMLLTRLKAAVAVVLVLGAIGLEIGTALPGARAQQPPAPKAPPTPTPTPTAARPAAGWKAEWALDGHEEPVQCLAFGKGDILVSGGKGSQVKVWDTREGTELATMGDPRLTNLTAITYAPDNSWVAFRSPDATHLAFGESLKDGRLVRFDGATQCPMNWGTKDGVRAPVAMTSDARSYVMQWDASGVAHIWYGLDMRTVGRPGHRVTSQPPLRGNKTEIRGAAFSPDDRLLATGGADQVVRIWEAVRGEERLALRGHAASVEVVEFSSDAKTLATVGKDGVAKLWDLTTAKERATLKADGVRCLVFAPDGKVLATGGEDGTVRVWDAGTAREESVLRGHTKPVAAVAFNRDGRRLASAGADKTIRLWKAGD